MRLASSVLLIVALLCVSISSSHQQSDGHCSDWSEAKGPQRSFKFGPFKFNYHYNESRSKDRFALSRSYYKISTEGSESYLDSFFNFKLTRFETLVDCKQNLTIDRPEYIPLIACMPLKSHVVPDHMYKGYGECTPDTDDQYVRRSSIRYKKRSAILNDETDNVLIYPLRENVVTKNISLMLDANNMHKFDNEEPRWDQGYYFEFRRYTLWRRFELKCTGEVHISTKRSQFFSSLFNRLNSLANDPYPEFLDDIQFIFAEGLRSGVLFSAHNVECADIPKDPSYVPSGIKLFGGLTGIYSQKFPYLSVDHNMDVRFPSYSIWKYKGTISQQRDVNQKDSNLYNTTIKIKSRSPLYPLEFDLDQKFVNEGPEKGHEYMTVRHNDVRHIFVAGSWQSGLAAKVMHLFYYNYKNLTQSVGYTKKILNMTDTEPLTISYVNQQDMPYIDISFKINRLYSTFISDFAARYLNVFAFKKPNDFGFIEDSPPRTKRDEL